LLDYVLSSDISLSGPAGYVTLVDDQTITLDDTLTLYAAVSGMVLVNQESGGPSNVGCLVVVDDSTEIPISGCQVNASYPYTNALAGSCLRKLGIYSAGTHTIALKGYGNQDLQYYCNAASAPSEYSLAILIVAGP
jgi:hypothetical protein